MKDSLWYQKNADILKALAHPTRLKIVDGLLQDACGVGKIVRGLGLPQSTVSQHLGILRNRKIIAPEKEGVRTCYRISDPRIQKLLEALKK